MCHVVFLGPEIYAIQTQFVRGLKEAGAWVTGIGHARKERLDNDLKRLLDAYVTVPSLLDAGNVLDTVREIDRRKAVDLIETTDETLVVAAAQVRGALELPGLSLRAALLCRDKPAMKAAMREAGVPCAEFTATSDWHELNAFAERVGFPLVLKPRAGMGALGTYRAESMAELAKAGVACGLDRGQSVAVEEFVEGHEGFYDTVTVDGEARHDFISHYYPNVLEAMNHRWISPQIVATNRVDRESYNEVRELGAKVTKTLDLGTCATHMEWFFGPQGLRFSEIGARPAGDEIWQLYTVGNEIDLYREWALAVVRGRVDSVPTRRYATGLVQVRPQGDGQISAYRGLREVFQRFRPWITSYHAAQPGTPVVPFTKGYLVNCWFRLKHPDYDQLRLMLDTIGQRLEILAG